MGIFSSGGAKADLNAPKNIEINRLISCTEENIVHYTETLFPELELIHPSSCEESISEVVLE